MTKIATDAAGKPITALSQARAFFDRNPDEILTLADMQLKWGCKERTAKAVRSALLREGVQRSQLPTTLEAPAPRRRKRGVPFPDNLTPAERRSIQAVMAHGKLTAAAQAVGISYDTINTQIRDARQKAGVHKTVELVEVFKAVEARRQAERRSI